MLGLGGVSTAPENWPALQIWHKFDGVLANATVVPNFARPGGVDLCPDLTITANGAGDPDVTVGALTTSDVGAAEVYARQPGSMSAAMLGCLRTKSVIMEIYANPLTTAGTGQHDLMAFGYNDGQTAANRQGVSVRWNGTSQNRFNFTVNGGTSGATTQFSDAAITTGLQHYVFAWDRRTVGGESGRGVEMWLNGVLVDTRQLLVDVGDINPIANADTCLRYMAPNSQVVLTTGNAAIHYARLWALTNYPDDIATVIAQMAAGGQDSLPSSLRGVS
jgi:hypothetical protein